ncbi:MAG: CBS domain-containing protein [Bacteroidales bacterium]|nr:CBS domain-containing protein [Bacteroidales bacterium]
MLAKDLISDIIPSLKTSDSGQKALYWMDIFRISHLPIVNNKEFLGLISDKDIYDHNMAEEPIGNHSLSLFSPFVTLEQHVYEVMEIASELNLSAVPVLDHEDQYQGAITMNDLMYGFADISALKQPGGILVLELNQNDYSLTEIAQIVESNDAKILSSYVTSSGTTTRMEVTLKINRKELTSIVQTFIRYNYVIKASFMDENDLNSLYEHRYESFMKYLNI